jgi:hypothetical protein
MGAARSAELGCRIRFPAVTLAILLPAARGHHNFYGGVTARGPWDLRRPRARIGDMRLQIALPLAALALAGSAGPAGGGAANRPTGTLVVVHRSEDRLTSIDLATGRRRTLKAPWLARCASAPYVTGGRLVVAGHRGRSAVTFTLDPSLRGPRRNLGPDWLATPSQRDGRLWMIDPPPTHFTSFPGLREVTVDGRVTFRTHRHVPAWNVQGSVDQGLLLERNNRLLVWDPRTGKVVRRAPGVFVVGTYGSLVASCGRGECRLGVQIADLLSGRRRVVRSPGSATLEPNGAFSPSGAHVAVTARSGGRRVIVLIDVAAGRAEVLAGSAAHRYYPSLTWSPSGEWLLWNTGGGRVMAYRPGAAAPVTLPFRIPRAMALAVG